MGFTLPAQDELQLLGETKLLEKKKPVHVPFYLAQILNGLSWGSTWTPGS
jgi:hypothetical protein